MNKLQAHLDKYKENSEQIANLQAEKLTLETEFKTQAELVASLKTENTAHSEALVAIKAELETRDSKITSLEKQIADFTQMLSEAEEDKTSAALEAKKIVQAIGISPLPIIKEGSQEAKTSSNDEIRTEYNSITDESLRFAFFAKHKDQILNS